MNRDDLENLLDELLPDNGNMKAGNCRISARLVAACTYCFSHDMKGESVGKLRAVILHWEETGELPK